MNASASWLKSHARLSPETAPKRKCGRQTVRCAVCQNQSVAESHADLARDMRRTIAEQLAAGRSEAEIIAYFRDRYGDFVLMRPPSHGSGAPLWWAPLGLLVVAGAGAFFYLRRRIDKGNGT